MRVPGKDGKHMNAWKSQLSARGRPGVFCDLLGGYIELRDFDFVSLLIS